MRYILDKLHSELAVFSELTSSAVPPSSVTPTSTSGSSSDGREGESSNGKDGEESNNSTIVSEIFGGVLQSDVRLV